MTQQLWAEVDHYIEDLLISPDPVLDEVLKSSTAAGLPAIQVSASQGKFLSLLAKAQGAKHILEIGTLGGYSTIWLARALPHDGRLITLEADAKHAEVARANIAHAGFANQVEVQLGNANKTLPKLAEEKKIFDFIFIDANKDNYPDYLTWSLKLSRPGTVIIADNTVRGGEVADASSTDINVQGVRRFNEMLAAEPRVSATIVQTVGNKGYDGFAMVLVTGNPK